MALVLIACKGGSSGEQQRQAEATVAQATSPAPESEEPAPMRDAPAPSLPAANRVFQPNFVGKEGPFSAGKAVPVKAPGSANGVLVLSCHHIFGPMGGLSADVPAADLPAFLQQVSLQSLDGKSIQIGPALAVPWAKTFVSPDASADVSVFKAPPELAQSALELAERAPPRDERVWLLTKTQGRDELLHAARVTHSDDKILVYQYDANNLQMRATSGAPIVNYKGQLVGLNLGGGSTPKGELRGIATPVPSLRRAIAEVASR